RRVFFILSDFLSLDSLSFIQRKRTKKKGTGFPKNWTVLLQLSEIVYSVASHHSFNQRIFAAQNRI
ncbi:MAG: hypothetical protein WBB17_06900, partial [Saprospiraceae bacterium]